MKPDESALAWLASHRTHVGELERRAKKSVVAMLRIQQNDSAAHVGCGVLLQIVAGASVGRFILSAAHVMDEFPNGGAQLGGSGKTVHALGSLRVSAGDEGQRREDDPLDAAVFRMRDDCDQPAGVSFLSLQDLGLRVQSECDLFLCGYLDRWTDVDRGSRMIRSDALSYVSSPHPVRRIGKVGYVPDRNILFELDAKQALQGAGEIKTMPKLAGLSGAGLWHFDHRDEIDIGRRARMVGIFTAHHRSAKVGAATSIAVHLAIIASAWPEFSEAIVNAQVVMSAY